MKKIIHRKRFFCDSSIPTDPVDFAKFITETAKQLGSTFVYIDTKCVYGDVFYGISFDYTEEESHHEYERRIQNEISVEAQERATYEKLKAKFETESEGLGGPYRS